MGSTSKYAFLLFFKPLLHSLSSADLCDDSQFIMRRMRAIDDNCWIAPTSRPLDAEHRKQHTYKAPRTKEKSRHLIQSNSSTMSTSTKTLRIRDLGYSPGIHTPGPSNSILDVPGVHVSQVTVPTTPNLPEWSTAVKGCTIITPRPPQDFYKPCAAATFTFNGNGELTGNNQIADWGFVNTPIGCEFYVSLPYWTLSSS